MNDEPREVHPVMFFGDIDGAIMHEGMMDFRPKATPADDDDVDEMTDSTRFQPKPPALDPKPPALDPPARRAAAD